MLLSEQDINRIITWCKLHKIKYAISERGHMVTVTKAKSVVQWWPLRGRVVPDGRTKRAESVGTVDDFFTYVEQRWSAQ